MACVGVKPEIRRQVIADFYQQNVNKGKFYTFKHFKRMGYKKTQIYANGYAAKSLDALKRRIREKIRLVDQDEIIRLFRSIKNNIQITADKGPYATFR